MNTMLFITLILSLALLTVSIFYIRAIEMLLKYKKREERRREHQENATKRILEQADEKAKAAKKSFDAQLDNLFKTHVAGLNKASSEMLEVYKKSLEKIQEEEANMLATSIGKMEQEAFSEISNFREILAKETVSAQKIVASKLEEEYALLETKLEAYKNERLKKIDEGIYKILEAVSKRVIGKALLLADHEELVISSLEEAKKKKIFD